MKFNPFSNKNSLFYKLLNINKNIETQHDQFKLLSNKMIFSLQLLLFFDNKKY